jgi:hypothetical protein
MNESYGRRGYAEPGRGYARGAQKNTRPGGVILAAIALLSAFLVIWGLYYATGISARHKVALAAFGCEPNLSPSGVPCTTAHVLAGRYTKITAPFIQQLNTDAAAYNAYERHRRVAAEAAVMAEATVANAFGRNLAQFPFPPAVAARAKVLIQANRALAKLCAEQARSTSFGQLWSFNDRIKLARAAEETDISVLGKAVARPPTPNQER